MIHNHTFITLAIVIILSFGFATTLSAAPTIVGPVTWDGNDADFFSSAVTPPVPAANLDGVANQALASVGATPFSDGELQPAGTHRTIRLNDGIYGNSNSWISDGDADTFAGVDFAGQSPLLITSVAWGRDNGNGAFDDSFAGTDACGGQCDDRFDGIYTLQRTLVTDPDASTLPTGDALSGWEDIANFTYPLANDDTVPGALFTGYFRHEYDITGGVLATGLRLTMSNNNIAIDEFEAFGAEPAAVPEPSTFLMAGLALAGLMVVSRRRRTRRVG